MPSTPFPPQNFNYPSTGYAAQPPLGNWTPQPTTAPMPVMAALANGNANRSPVSRPTIRMQAPDSLLSQPAPRPTPFVLPSPEALGIRAGSAAAPVPPTIDWNAAHARLQRLGALGFHMVHLPQGSVRVTFLLPEDVSRAHQIEVVAETETAAVTAALDSAEAWALARK